MWLARLEDGCTRWAALTPVSRLVLENLLHRLGVVLIVRWTLGLLASIIGIPLSNWEARSEIQTYMKEGGRLQ